MELMKNAVSGWRLFIENGKFPVLLFGIVLFLWWNEWKHGKKKERQLLVYATLTVTLVVCPVTAGLLMKYQTRFYDYEWLWSLVPMTLMIAYGGTVLFTIYCKKWSGGSRWKLIVWVVCALAAVLLCGNPGGKALYGQEEAAKTQKAAIVMDDLTEDGKNKDICILAPRQIMESARAVNGDVKLLYGRNMWEEALGAYSYDTYAPQIRRLYEWMESLTQLAGEDEAGASDFEVLEADAGIYLAAALESGVNRILLPDTVPEQMVLQIQEILEQLCEEELPEPYSLEGYLIFTI